MWFYGLLLVGVIGAFVLLSYMRKLDHWGRKKSPDTYEEDQLGSRPPIL